MKIKFIKFDERVEIPVRKHHSDTGADCKMICDGTIFPGETLVVPCGFGIIVPNGYSARMQVRTSVARKGIMVQGCAIDAGYNGELSYVITNASHKAFQWLAGDRLCYIEVYPCVYPEFVENLGKERADGAFGSTGR